MFSVKAVGVNKVITTMVIRPLDDLTRCVQSVGSPICNPSVWSTWESGMGSFDSPPMGSY